jgi:hypothetical protein
MVFPGIALCHFCEAPATFREFCEDCYEERIEAYIAPQELIIEFPCSHIHAGVLHVLRTQLTSREGELNHVLRPFTLDNPVTYRQFLVQKHPGLFLTMPVALWHVALWHRALWHMALMAHGMAWHGTAWHGMARHGMEWHGRARHGMARHGTVWHGMARHGMAR